MEKEISLKDLLETTFTINDNGEMVGSFTLKRINMIGDVLTQQYKEIERLKVLCDRYEEEHRTTFEEWKKDINIINELDNWLGKKILSWEDDGNVSDNIYHERLAIQMIYFKLQELKGSDKEWMQSYIEK